MMREPCTAHALLSASPAETLRQGYLHDPVLRIVVIDITTTMMHGTAPALEYRRDGRRIRVEPGNLPTERRTWLENQVPSRGPGLWAGQLEGGRSTRPSITTSRLTRLMVVTPPAGHRVQLALVPRPRGDRVGLTSSSHRTGEMHQFKAEDQVTWNAPESRAMMRPFQLLVRPARRANRADGSRGSLQRGPMTGSS